MQKVKCAFEEDEEGIQVLEIDEFKQEIEETSRKFSQISEGFSVSPVADNRTAEVTDPEQSVSASASNFDNSYTTIGKCPSVDV